MLAKTKSIALMGVDAREVVVEVDVASGLPAFQIVGLGDQAVNESKERVRAAIKNSGFVFPAARITVNLAPSDLRKEGVLFDLPIALCLLATQGLIPLSALENTLIAGELALDGELRPVHGILNLLIKASSLEHRALIPWSNATEAAILSDVESHAPQSLLQAVHHLNGTQPLPRTVKQPAPEQQVEDSRLCLSDIKGQIQAKRALTIAIAGGHNLLLMGSPGSGKTMLSRRSVSLLPTLTQNEALEVTRIHSASGILGSQGLITVPPYRSPHHSVSDAGLIGGGSVPKPGEVSLAHHGILFLDELPEFSSRVLESLRQPLEDGQVTISRARATVSYPAKFQLIAAMNPCPCGYWGDTIHGCTCSPLQRQRYSGKISGPLLDRIDLVVEVPRLSIEELRRVQSGDPSAALKANIQTARQQMLSRQKYINSQLSGKLLRTHTQLDAKSLQLMTVLSQQLQLTGRGFDRILRVARTIADLSGAASIQEHHLAEAAMYRPKQLMHA